MFVVEVSEEEVRREREKARALRASRWWSNRIAKGDCHYCGGRFPPAQLTMDHLLPIIRGGRSTRGNLVPACKECNSKKRYLLPIEWTEYLTRLGRPERASAEPEPESEEGLS